MAKVTSITVESVELLSVEDVEEDNVELGEN